MLLLTRKPGEEIIIGDDLIRIKIVQINGNQVRLGIEAPKELEVHRLEIYEKIKRGESHRKSSILFQNNINEFENHN